ncbi:citrate lyase subunit alpha [Pectinatus haikarae]|uniref:Citrate lyase alpha chain n=1 Tax=Pectinatus haikarae TaxID=349096 RepID=A0ABT9Y755_9FIRM|nr:citrate lyase subunit alpha [Pectinatus haikarae]MDQ0203661.1 citrate lyase subunit alpha/citrate CoA-transferase [Pectinatus haikarae]
MKNAVGREIPAHISGISNTRLYEGTSAYNPAHTGAGKKLRAGKPHTDKILKSIDEAIEKTGLKNGQTISFHHHLRNGDYVMKMVMECIAAKGIKDITIASSSLSPCHDFLIDYIRDGTVTALESSGLRGQLGKYLTKNPGALKKPTIIRSHGGRARAIEAGELHIDTAFMAAPTCDRQGNATGRIGKSAFGSMGYAMIDAAYADKVVLITDNLVNDPVYPYSIPQTQVDYIVPVEAIGDPEGIASGAIRITKSPTQLLIAEYAAEVMDETGVLKDGFSMQMGSGGASLAAAKFIREKMEDQNITGSFGIGGITGIFADMLKDGLFKACYDAQTFDTTAVKSLSENPNHIEISASFYANPWNAGPIVNDLDVVILSATEVDLDFNVNVITDSNGICMGASGGHSDTAAGAALTIIVVPLIRGRLPMIRNHVQNVVTPGDDVDVIITERGLAINPKRTDLIEKLKDSKLPIMKIEDLQQLAYAFVGKPEEIKLSDDDRDIVAVVEYRDGSILDVIRKPLV